MGGYDTLMITVRLTLARLERPATHKDDEDKVSHISVNNGHGNIYHHSRLQMWMYMAMSLNWQTSIA